MTHRTSVRSLFLAAVFSLASLAPLAAQSQDAETLFLEGMSAFRNGDHDTALQRFREVIKLDPTRADAMKLMAESQDALTRLMMAGGEFQTFALEVLREARAQRREAVMDADAAAAAAEGCFAGNYADRAKAIFKLGQTYGPFAVPPLVAAFAKGDQSRSEMAVYALHRLGSDALVPLLAATESPNVDVQRGAVQALLLMGDSRADARLAEMASDASLEGSIRVLAGSAGGGDAAALYAQQGWAYYVNDPKRGLTEVENYGVLWQIDGSRLSPIETPAPLVPLELARDAFARSSALGNPDAPASEALVLGAEAGYLASNGDADGAAAKEAAALQLGPAAVDRALGGALQRGDLSAQSALVGLLDGPGAGASANLHNALQSPYPTVRFGAAIALAHDGDASPDVVGLLASAAQLQALRVVSIMDSDAQRAGALASALDGQGIVAVVADSGAQGLLDARRATVVDAFVVADPLPDLYARRVVKELRNMSDYSDTPVFVLGSEQTGDIDSAEVVDQLSAAEVAAAFGELDVERQGYTAAATAAAEALDRLSFADPAAVAAVAGDLAQLLGRDDALAIPAMHALGRVDGGSASTALLGVVADQSRSSAARAAAADALAGILGRDSGALQAAAGETLRAAAAAGDAALARSCSRVLGMLPAAG